MEEAERCNQVGMLLNGSILSIGKPNDLEAGYPYQMVKVKAKPHKWMREVVAESKNMVSWRPVGDRVRIAVTESEKYIQRLENAEKVLQMVEGVVSVSQIGSLLHVITDRGKIQKVMRRTLQEAGVSYIKIEKTIPSLEDAFVRMVEDQEEEKKMGFENKAEVQV